MWLGAMKAGLIYLRSHGWAGVMMFCLLGVLHPSKLTHMTRERSWFYDTALPYKWLLHTTCPSTVGLQDEKAEKPIAPSFSSNS